MASSSSITPSFSKMYDVFLSFGGDQDTPHSFIRRLYDVLRENNISTFTDDNLQRGDETSSDLLKAIEESRISLIIFSKGYASSRSCLNELVRIIECREKYKQIVIPVFYDIDPSQVRKQIGPVAEAFKEYEVSFDGTSSVQEWRNALSGYILSEFNTEAALDIVDDILKKLKRMHIEDIIKRYRVHEDEDEFHDDIVNFKKRYYSSHKDEEALHDDIVNFKKRYYSGHKDEEALHDAFLNFIKRTSGYKDEDEDVGDEEQDSSSSSMKKHDVYLCFRGEDTRFSFTSHLYDVLRENKISTFNDENFPRGFETSSALLKAIEESRISLIIFSRNCASSSWCLEELVKILECREKYNQIVIPVFYDIDPSEVRHQTGPFAEAFKNHEARFDITSVQKWRNALTLASALSGFHLQSSKSEAALTQVIVDEILKKLEEGAIHEPKPSSSNIGESDSSHKDEEADDNEDTGEQNRGGGGGGGGGGDDGGGGGGGDGGDGGGSGGDGGGEEAIHDTEWFQWITTEQKFASTNFILDLPSVVFDKLSSVHKPQYALASMLLSFMTMLIGIIQLVIQGRNERVGWKRREKIPWFYYPSDKPFGTVTDFIGLICGIFQSIFTAIDYALYLRHINDPIQISIWPLVFSFCLMCSTFFKEFPKKDI